MSVDVEPDRARQLELVNSRLDELLSKCDPRQVEPKEFWGAQFDMGLAWVHFPTEYGGLSVDRFLQSVVDQRLKSAGAQSNVPFNIIGVSMMSATVMAFGSDSHRERFLRRAFTCEEIWCQLFSEPGAGSDLASLACRASRDGDEWVVNGQKVWTTLAHRARFALLLARTDIGAVKHRGLTFFILDMQASGVEIRPLRQLTGDAEYNEVFLTDVRIPDLMRLGEIGQGWTVAMTTLLAERVTIGGLDSGGVGSGPSQHAVGCWHAASPDQRTAANRDRLITLWAESEALRLTRIRLAESGQVMGPASLFIKSARSILDQKIYGLCMNLRGPEALLIDHYDFSQPDRVSQASSDSHSDLTKAYLSYQGMTIGGGTPEITKTAVGEAILGLPPEPRVDKDIPWKDVPRN
jgi:alkylation response protein AidB-like acyl-CoA dehydrogenase